MGRRAVPVRRFISVTLGLTSLALISMGSVASAQTLSLRDLISDFVRTGVTLAPPAEGADHSAHFNDQASDQFQALTELNQGIGRQIANYPVNSSAGGFAYELDPDLGVFIRPTQSFGSVYTERPLTLGKGRYNVGLSVTEFSFDDIDGLQLEEGDIQLVFNHEDTNGDGSNLEPHLEGDLVSSQLYLRIKSRVTALVASYGVSDRFDLGMAMPFVDVDLQLTAVNHVERVSTGNRDIHTFNNGTDTDVDRRFGSASGVGDVSLRGKYQFLRNSGNYLAGAAQVKLPTGDVSNLLGTGETQVSLWLLASHIGQTVNPTLNLGYIGSSGDLPNEFRYTGGLSWAVDPKLTLSADLLGRTLFDVQTVQMTSSVFTYIPVDADPGSPGTTPAHDPGDHDPDSIEEIELDQLSLSEESTVSSLQGSIGFKLNVASTVLVTVNGLFPINKTGLNDDFTALLGIDYSF